MSDKGYAWATTNQLQCYKDGELAVASPGEDCTAEDDPLSFKASWSRFRLQLWLGDILPKVIAWFRENEPKIAADHASDDDSSDSEYPWVLLVRERNRLLEFKKEGSTNGRDLQTVRGPQGKRWMEQTLYFASKYTIPDSIWRDGCWEGNEDTNAVGNIEEQSDAIGPKPHSSTVTTGKGKERATTPSMAPSVFADEGNLLGLKLEDMPNDGKPKARVTTQRSKGTNTFDTTPANHTPCQKETSRVTSQLLMTLRLWDTQPRASQPSRLVYPNSRCCSGIPVYPP
ncbi:hypothetical protein BJV78DRAFT_1208358, partial [Lactifluus subvellereus]